ncbi:hypothetical protein HY640_00245 [Candidatus Woesearchaeota archaeon]|nr:hypothetical protein [Candidatus Woesearchaeota archaeon]
MRFVNGFEALHDGSRFVDVYVTTDPSEVGEILAQLGFSYSIYRGEDYHRVFPDYFDRYGNPINERDCLLALGFVNHAKGLRADCIDTPLTEALGVKNLFGFMPMSKIRVALERVSVRGASNELSALLSGLLEERQNAAFVNEDRTSAYVVLSEFYK